MATAEPQECKDPADDIKTNESDQISQDKDATEYLTSNPLRIVRLIEKSSRPVSLDEVAQHLSIEAPSDIERLRDELFASPLLAHSTIENITLFWKGGKRSPEEFLTVKFESRFLK